MAWGKKARHKNFSRTQCLSCNLLLKQSRHCLTFEPLEPQEYFLLLPRGDFSTFSSNKCCCLGAKKANSNESDIKAGAEKRLKSFWMPLCVLCKCMSCLLLFIYFTLVPVAERSVHRYFFIRISLSLVLSFNLGEFHGFIRVGTWRQGNSLDSETKDCSSNTIPLICLHPT